MAAPAKLAGHGPLVGAVQVGVQQAHGHRVAGVDPAETRHVQRRHLGAVGGEPPGHLVAAVAAHQRLGPVGERVVQRRAVLSGDLDDVGEALRRDQAPPSPRGAPAPRSWRWWCRASARRGARPPGPPGPRPAPRPGPPAPTAPSSPPRSRPTRSVNVPPVSVPTLIAVLRVGPWRGPERRARVGTPGASGGAPFSEAAGAPPASPPGPLPQPRIQAAGRTKQEAARGTLSDPRSRSDPRGRLLACRRRRWRGGRRRRSRGRRRVLSPQRNATPRARTWEISGSQRSRFFTGSFFELRQLRRRHPSHQRCSKQLTM